MLNRPSTPTRRTSASPIRSTGAVIGISHHAESSMPSLISPGVVRPALVGYPNLTPVRHEPHRVHRAKIKVPRVRLRKNRPPLLLQLPLQAVRRPRLQIHLV